MPDRPIRVLIADDHEIVRTGIRLLVNGQADMEVIAEARDGAEAVALSVATAPDVVLMDISMPEMSGIEATRAIKATRSEVEIVGLTMHSDERYFFELLKAGASGYVVKGGAPHELLEAIRAAARGQAYIHPSVAGRLIGDFVERAQSGEAELDGLTDREREVLEQIALGLTGREIAAQLEISANTVDRHRSNIMAKLDLHNKAALVRYAVRKGLIEDE